MCPVKPRASSPAIDAVIERYMRDVDRSLLRRNLTLSHEQRMMQLQDLARFADELRHAGQAARGKRAS
jgi:hypothetical protein